MNKFYYDLHIHSGLSPCSEDDMTPNNIINMSILKGLDIISVTDHNSSDNSRVIKKLADQKDILFLPGIEIESEEEIHYLAYFNTIDKLEEFSVYIKSNSKYIKNNEKIFGNQNIYNDVDEKTGNIERLLLNPTSIKSEDIIYIVNQLNGIIIPSHVDRSSYSIVNTFGFIPSEFSFRYLEFSNEISRENIIEKNKINRELEKYKYIINSDAHNLGMISERKYFLTKENDYEILKMIGI